MLGSTLLINCAVVLTAFRIKSRILIVMCTWITLCPLAFKAPHDLAPRVTFPVLWPSLAKQNTNTSPLPPLHCLLLIIQNIQEVLSFEKLFLNSPSSVIALLLSLYCTIGVFLVKYCARPAGIICKLIFPITCELPESRGGTPLQGHLTEGMAEWVASKHLLSE